MNKESEYVQGHQRLQQNVYKKEECLRKIVPAKPLSNSSMEDLVQSRTDAANPFPFFNDCSISFLNFSNALKRMYPNIV